MDELAQSFDHCSRLPRPRSPWRPL